MNHRPREPGGPVTPWPWNLGSWDGVSKGQMLQWPHKRRGTQERHVQIFYHPGVPIGTVPMEQGVVTQPWGPRHGQEGTIKGLRLGPQRD